MTTNKSWEEKLRELWHVRSVNMAQEVTDYSKVEGMIADWWIDKAKEIEKEKEAYQRAVEDLEVWVYENGITDKKSFKALITKLQALKGEEIK